MELATILTLCTAFIWYITVTLKAISPKKLTINKIREKSSGCTKVPGFWDQLDFTEASIFVASILERMNRASCNSP